VVRVRQTAHVTESDERSRCGAENKAARHYNNPMLTRNRIFSTKNVFSSV